MALKIEDITHRTVTNLAKDKLGSAKERTRKREANIRVCAYRDDGETDLIEQFNKIFTDGEVRKKIAKFASFANGQAVFKRIINEVARPVYCVPPTRKVFPEAYQPDFNLMATASRLNHKMDLACRLINACNDVVLFSRYVERLERVVIDVLSPNQYSVIEDPDDPTVALAYIYDRQYLDKTWRVYWDDEITMQLDENYNPVPYAKGGPDYIFHGLPRMPFVGVHRTERSGCYFDETTGNDLLAAHRSCQILTSLSLRLLKNQGFSKTVVTGDFLNFPQGQILDEESAIIAPDGTNITTLNDRADANHYLTLQEAIKTDIAASRGISRARLNQDAAGASSDVGLAEERSELIRVMQPVEIGQFEVMRMLSIGKIPETAIMTIDFGELHHRVDRETQLKIRAEERKMGLRSVIDDIREDNPEIETEKEAWEELDENMEAEAEFIQRRRALNISEESSVLAPGQDAEQNGSLGPMVRDGEISKDEAAEFAQKGPIE